MSKTSAYLLADQTSELERLQLQSRVWEPAARDLLNQLTPAHGFKALEVGCGAMGWLRVLSQWVGPGGSVVGSDLDEKMLAAARQLLEDERLANVTLARDDLFNSQFAPASFDLVHSRFQIAPLGRAREQVAAYKRLLKPGGVLVLEDPDLASWRVNPDCPAVQQLIELIERGFEAAGGNFNSGRELPGLLRGAGMAPRVVARIIALEAGHPYLRLPLQFAMSLGPRLQALIPAAELAQLLRRAERELARPGVWGTTFTLVQAYATADSFAAS